MPVIKCKNNKYRIGTGPCVFTSKEKAERAYAAYRAKSHTESIPYDAEFEEVTLEMLPELRKFAKEHNLESEF